MKTPFELDDSEETISNLVGLTHGLYEIYWKSGGSSLAAVGYDREGNNWFAPCNWTSGSTIYWSDVVAYKLLFANDYSRKTKGVKSIHPKTTVNAAI